jgi:hypothetical protein
MTVAMQSPHVTASAIYTCPMHPQIRQIGVAMNSAQVTLVKGDLRGIAEARRISKQTVANMKQNLGLAFLYNSLSPHGRRCPVSPHWRAALADDCGAGDEFKFSVGHHKRFETWKGASWIGEGVAKRCLIGIIGEWRGASETRHGRIPWRGHRSNQLCF